MLARKYFGIQKKNLEEGIAARLRLIYQLKYECLCMCGQNSKLNYSKMTINTTHFLILIINAMYHIDLLNYLTLV
jgi:hypothetical protein